MLMNNVNEGEDQDSILTSKKKTKKNSLNLIYGKEKNRIKSTALGRWIKGNLGKRDTESKAARPMEFKSRKKREKERDRGLGVVESDGNHLRLRNRRAASEICSARCPPDLRRGAPRTNQLSLEEHTLTTTVGAFGTRILSNCTSKQHVPKSTSQTVRCCGIITDVFRLDRSRLGWPRKLHLKTHLS